MKKMCKRCNQMKDESEFLSEKGHICFDCKKRYARDYSKKYYREKYTTEQYEKRRDKVIAIGRIFKENHKELVREKNNEYKREHIRIQFSIPKEDIAIFVSSLYNKYNETICIYRDMYTEEFVVFPNKRFRIGFNFIIELNPSEYTSNDITDIIKYYNIKNKGIEINYPKDKDKMEKQYISPEKQILYLDKVFSHIRTRSIYLVYNKDTKSLDYISNDRKLENYKKIKEIKRSKFFLLKNSNSCLITGLKLIPFRIPLK